MMKPGELLITADTIVWLEGKVLGKPEGREGAVEMLRALSGKSHQVFTGVCLTTTEWQKASRQLPMCCLMYCPKTKSSTMLTVISQWIKQEPMVFRNGSDILE